MDRRTPITGAKPPATGATKPTAGETARKQADLAARLSSTNTKTTADNAGSTLRSSALASRTSGSTINKPPTRPLISSTRKPASNAASLASGDGTENKRPTARTSAIGAAAARTARPDVAGDKGRRTTLGGATASVPPKRPAPSSRTSTASPNKPRPTAATPGTSKPASAKTPKSPTSDSTKSTTGRSARSGSTTSSIPEEEPEPFPPVASTTPATTTLPTVSEAPEAFQFPPRPPSPRKLEIRRPPSHSDAELETKPQFRRGHSRTQSVQVRPSTAPSWQALSEKEQGIRDMEIVQNLLRESTRRDGMAAEMRDLKAEVARLESSSASAAETARNGEGGALKSKDSVERERLRKEHAAELEELKAIHARDLSTLRSELEGQRTQSTKFAGVEEKIRAVEDQLQDTRSKATRNEQELQNKLQQKDAAREQLAQVVEDLKDEIDKCQIKLDADVVKQKKEKLEVQKALEALRTELEYERRQRKEADELAEKERLERDGHFTAVLKEARETAEGDMEKLRQTAASAEEAVRRSREELDGVRDEGTERIERHRAAIEEVQETNRSLQVQLDGARKQHNAAFGEAKQAGQESEKLAADFRGELQALREIREQERRDAEENSQSTTKVVEELQDQIAKLQQDGSDSGKVVEDLQTQLRGMQQLKQDAESKYKSELDDVEKVVERLQTDSSGMKRAHEDALCEKTEAAEVISKVARDLQAQLQMKADTEVKHQEELKKLQDIVESLRHDCTSMHQARDDALRQKDEAAESTGKVVEDLQNKTVLLQQRLEDAKAAQSDGVRELEDTVRQRDEAAQALKKVVEDLQSHNVHLQQQLEDARASQSDRVKQLESTVEKMKQESDALEQRSVEQVEAKDRELADVKKVVGDLQIEIRRQQQDAEDARSQLEEAEKQAAGLGQAVEGLQNEVQALQHRVQDAEAAAMATEMVKESKESEIGVVKEECEVLVKQFDELKARQVEHDREAEEKDERLNDAESAKAEAESALLQLKKELAALQKVLEIFEQDAVEKEAGHASALARLRRETEKKYDIDMHGPNTKLEEQMRELRETLAAEHSSAATDLQKKCDIAAAEKTRLEEQLSEIEARHSKRLEAATQGKAAYEKLQCAMDHLRHDHSRDLAGKTEAHQRAVGDLHRAISELKNEHSKALGSLRASLSAEHERHVRNIMNTHAAQIVELDGQVAWGEQDRANATETETPSKGLGHVFVNHGIHRDNEGTAETPETPLAYASTDGGDQEEVHQYFSTPGYPKGGARAGAIPFAGDAAYVMRQHGGRSPLEAENAELLAALKVANDEIAALRDSQLPGRRFGVVSREFAESEDPFAPATNGQTAQASSPRPPSETDGEWSGNMTLEGTLESIRVQTEQLMEINDDFLAEQRRWSSRLGVRSGKSSAMGLRSPVR